MKKCNFCGETKELCEFHKDKKGTYGVSNKCKVCRKKYRVDNKDKILEQEYKWKENNIKKVREHRRKYIGKLREEGNYYEVVRNMFYGGNWDKVIIGEGVIDHKVPITWFKEETPIELINHINNLWRVSNEYNCSKKNKWCDIISYDYYNLIRPHIKEQYISVLKHDPHSKNIPST